MAEADVTTAPEPETTKPELKEVSATRLSPENVVTIPLSAESHKVSLSVKAT